MTQQILTIDIGGTTIKSAIYQTDGQCLLDFPEQTTQKTPTSNQIAAQIAKLAQDVQRNHTISGVAISSSAIIHPFEGRVLATGVTIPEYTGTELKATIEQATGLPCTAENDVNCAALGESWLGAGQGSKSLFCITVGTGVGGAALMNGRLWHGYNFAAGEIGFIPVPPHGEIFESTASTSALLQLYLEKTGESVNGKVIFERAAQGERAAIDSIDTLIDNLAIGLCSVIYVFAPETLIIGGGIAQQKTVFEPKLRAALEKRVIKPYFMPQNIICAALGNRAGMIGALRHFLQCQEIS